MFASYSTERVGCWGFGPQNRRGGDRLQKIGKAEAVLEQVDHILTVQFDLFTHCDEVRHAGHEARPPGAGLTASDYILFTESAKIDFVARHLIPPRSSGSGHYIGQRERVL